MHLICHPSLVTKLSLCASLQIKVVLDGYVEAADKINGQYEFAGFREGSEVFQKVHLDPRASITEPDIEIFFDGGKNSWVIHSRSGDELFESTLPDDASTDLPVDQQVVEWKGHLGNFFSTSEVVFL